MNENWVLTAAHCIQNPDLNSHRLVFGLHARDNENGTLSRRPSVIRIHPGWDNMAVGLPNDIGVMKLETPIDLLKPGISPVRLVSSDVGPLDNVDCVATGWGQLYTGGPRANILQQASIKVFPLDQCKAEGFPAISFKFHICAKDEEEKKTICRVSRFA